MKTNLEHQADGFAIKMKTAKDMQERLQVAYDCGIDSWRDPGSGITKCPYAYGSDEFDAWDKGFIHGVINFIYIREA